MAKKENIEVNELSSFPRAVFEVVVSDGNQTRHRVTVPEEYYNKLTKNEITPAELVKRSFEFLLEREPKEAILGEFELTVISRYFSEYEESISIWH